MNPILPARLQNLTTAAEEISNNLSGIIPSQDFEEITIGDVRDVIYDAQIVATKLDALISELHATQEYCDE